MKSDLYSRVEQLCQETHENVLLAELEEQLTEATLISELTKSQDIRRMINIGSKLVGLPLIYTDIRRCALIMLEDYATENPDWNEIQKNGCISFRLWNSPELQKDPGSRTSHPVPGTDFRFIALHYRDTIRGALLVLVEKDFSDEAERRLQIVARFCETLEGQTGESLTAQRMDMDDFIATLLEGVTFPEYVLEFRLKRGGWALKGELHLIVIDLKEEDPEFHYYVLSQQIPLRGNDRVFFYNNYMVFITDRLVNPMDPETAFSELKEFLRDNDLHGGLSHGFESMQQIRKNYLQGQKALSLGKAMGHPDTFYHYENYALLHLLESCADRVSLEEFCHPSVLKLRDFDQENDSELLPTLKRYIGLRASAARVAEELHVHKNTVVYRIKRATEIMNLDLNNGDHLASIILSLKILEYLSSLEH